MKIGIMQPYFAPYIGYWQLMNSVDLYVIYDDVNYIKGGWINRNRILVNNSAHYFNIPLLGASPNKLINELVINHDPRLIQKMLRQLDGAYHNAPYYNGTMPIWESILACDETNLTHFIINSFDILCDFLDIKTPRIISSSINKNNLLRGEDKVINICKKLDATEYINAIGGKHLYSAEHFSESGLKLKFLSTNQIRYSQFTDKFEPNLSIIDVMMFNSQPTIHHLLSEYLLISAQ